MKYVFSTLLVVPFFGGILLYSVLTYRNSPAAHLGMASSVSAPVNLNWFPPTSTWITNLTAVVNGTGTYGFKFAGLDSASNTGQAVSHEYNYCNMPHVGSREYQVPEEKYELIYVELIQRHHKRTPYAANGFPEEVMPWDCSDTGLFFFGQPLKQHDELAASTYWSVFTSPSNPFKAATFQGTCQFPQLTKEGLDNSWKHGNDLKSVYQDLLGFIPNEPSPDVLFRVTNNVITSQVASMVIAGMYPDTKRPQIPLQIQPVSIDSLEPKYVCATANSLYANFSSGGKNPTWTAHLDESQSLMADLDRISGVPPSDPGFHVSYDHYFDNLSSRQCHGKPLPCSAADSSQCITQSMADSVYRLGEYEYSYTHRAAPESLQAAVGYYGVWIAELAQNIRDAISGTTDTKYRHNIAHDGSIARVLSILQVDVMVWPGMGSEVVFEVYKVRGNSDDANFAVRVLWGAVPLKSSNPSLGLLDMVSLDVLLSYFDGLVGVAAGKVVQFCVS